MKKVLAFFLLLLGVGMVFSGIYYNEVLGFLGINKKEENSNDIPEVITCIRKEKNNDAELSISETSRMHFSKKGLLVNIEDTVVVSPIDNSTESQQKLNKYYLNMEEVLDSFKDFGGFEEEHSQDANLVKYSMFFDLKNFSNSKRKTNKTEEDSLEKVEKSAISTDEYGNAIIDFSSIDKDGKIKFTYKDKYSLVRKIRENEGYTCTT